MPQKRKTLAEKQVRFWNAKKTVPIWDGFPENGQKAL
jgi:hypothetical protein